MKSNAMKHDDVPYTMVTPAMAEAWLERNTNNRPLRPGVVEKYARDMKAGLWQKNAQPVTIDWNDAIHNGQHRLFAVMEADMAIPMFVITGVDPATVLSVDSGAPRSYADFLKLMGGSTGNPIKNVNNFQACLRLTHWYENRWPSVKVGSSGGGAPTHHELDAIAHAHPQMSANVDHVVAQFGPLRNIASPTRMAWVYAMAAEVDPTRAEHWLQQLRSNEGPQNNPAISLRAHLTKHRLAGNKLDAATEVCFIIKSWNAFALDESLVTYRWGADEPMPAIYGTKQYTGKRSGHTAVHEIKKASPRKASIGRRISKKGRSAVPKGKR